MNRGEPQSVLSEAQCGVVSGATGGACVYLYICIEGSATSTVHVWEQKTTKLHSIQWLTWGTKVIALNGLSNYFFSGK